MARPARAANKDTRSLYTIIRNDLREKIFRGELKPGDLLPSENQLCSEYGASRETVRKGLKELENEKLIFSRPKIGYFVSTPNHSDFSLSYSEDLEGCSTQYYDIHGILPDEQLQQKLKIAPNRKVIELSQITRDIAGQPVAYNVKYVPYERAYPSVESEMRFAVLPDLTFSKMATFDFYTSIQVSAVSASGHIAEALECPEGEALLLVEQTFIKQDGVPIGYSQHFSRSPHGNLHGTAGHQL